MVKRKQKDIINTLLLIFAVLFVNAIAESFILRIDLTSDKRYTINDLSKQAIKKIDDNVYIKIYLDGEMPVEFKKLRSSIKECIDELSVYSPKFLQYDFINPFAGNENESENDAIYSELRQKGLIPMPIQVNDNAGGFTQRIIFPSAIVSFKGKEKAINFFNYNDELSQEENINLAYQNIEFEIVSAIKLLTRKHFPRLAFIEGHGELDFFETGDIEKELSQYCKVCRVKIDGNVGALDNYKAVIVAKPQTPWSEADKFAIDQYIMKGGNVAWFIDEVSVREDSLACGDKTYAMQNNHNLDDLLFRYGARINPNLVQDLQCAYIPVNIAPAGAQANFKPMPWMYYPLLMPNDTNIISKGINLVKAQYASTIDFVGTKKNETVKKILLKTSESVKTVNVPAIISLQQIKDKITEMDFNNSSKIIATILEGNFESGFKNRITTTYNNGKPFDFIGDGKHSKMFIASDGDIIRNDVLRHSNYTTIVPLGFDRYLNRTFGNKEFVKNVILYLTDEDGLLNIRSHNIKLRLLDKELLAINHTRIIFINTVFPFTIIIVFAVIFSIVRKRKYSKKLK